MSNEIPAGRYTGRAVKMAFGGKPGNERIGVRFELLNEGFQGRYVIWYQGLTNETGIDIAMRGLRDAGWTGDDLATVGPETGLGSTEVELGVSYREYEGRPQMDVKVFAMGGGAIFKEDKSLDERSISALAARLKGAVIKSKRPVTGAAGTSTPSFLSRPSRPAPAVDGWDGTGAEPSYDDADYDGRAGRNGPHVEDDGVVPGF